MISQDTDTNGMQSQPEGERPIFHMVGNAHLDPAWMWTWNEGMEAFLATCRSAIDRMEETPAFIFTCSSAAHYRWVEEAEPELFQRIREQVCQGRWAIAGGWWTQADCNIPSGEGFVRQALLGQRYFLDRFGIRARTGYSPDAFGHGLGLPQLLARSGMTGYIFCRPDPTELALPSPLVRWTGPDGSSVLAYRVPFHYNMYESSVPKKVGDLAAALHAPSPLAAEHTLAKFGPEWMLFYGVGNHGGGPTREHIAQIIALRDNPTGPQPVFSTPDRFFRQVQEHPEQWNIPEWRDDLQLNAPGCYSAHSRIKQLNRRSEHLLMAAERAASLEALLAGGPYPALELRRAWENVCFNHFHDIICGVAIREALDDAVDMYGEAVSIAKHTTRMALQRLARRIDTTGPGQTLMIFNTHAWELKEQITFELWHDIDKSLWSRPVDIRVTDDAGNELPCQTGYTSGKIGKDRIAVTFPAHLPALGWRCYRVFYGEPSTVRLSLHPASTTVLENQHLRIEISPQSGALVSMVDKERGVELLAGPSALGVVIDDPTDTWGHGVERFNRVAGMFGNADVRLVENGPVYATIRSRSHWGGSWLQQDFRMYHDARHLEVRVRIFWAEQHRMLKLAFHTALDNATAFHEGAYCVTEKPCDGIERPRGTWSAVAGECAGRPMVFAIIDDAKHGCSAVTGGPDSGNGSGDNHGTGPGTSLLLTVLRSPGYATHDPHPYDPNEDTEIIDQGAQRFTYILAAESGKEWKSGLARRGMVLNAPPLPHLESMHPSGRSPLGRSGSFIQSSSESVIVTAVKQDEDGNGWIVRLFESAGTRASATISIPPLGLSWDAEFEPFQLRTFQTGSGGIQEVDLTEYRVQ